MTAIVASEPELRVHRQGVPVTLDQLEPALRALASAAGRDEHSALIALAAQARDRLQGSGDDRELAGLLAVSIFGGTSSTPRRLLAPAHSILCSSRVPMRFFSHNSMLAGQEPQRFDLLVHRLGFVSSDTTSDAQLHLLEIGDTCPPARQAYRWLEQPVATALGLDRVISSIEIRFPLEVLSDDRYRFDLKPFTDALQVANYSPVYYAGEGDTAPEYAALRRLVNASLCASPELEFLKPPLQDPDAQPHPFITLSFEGCSFSHRGIMAGRETTPFQCVDTVITGPLEVDHTDQPQRPTLIISLRQQRCWTTALQAALRDLANQIATAVAR